VPGQIVILNGPPRLNLGVDCPVEVALERRRATWGGGTKPSTPPGAFHSFA
jgi:hypothetical protein